MTLSKSDFKLASSCPKKLVYKKTSFQTVNDSNEYMEMLAQGGYIVAKYAQLIYPDGIEISDESLVKALKETKKLIEENENITLFEATILSDNKLIRIDILEKKGNVFNLIEVKSESFDSSAKNNKHQEAIEDVAYQTMVLKEAYPEFEINSFLLLPDKSKRTDIDGLAGWFRVNEMIEEKFEMEELPAQNVAKFNKPKVEFKYYNDPDKKKYIDRLIKDNLLTLIDMNEEVENIMEDIVIRSDRYLDILINGIKPEDFTINKNCSKCEFNLGSETVDNGFRNCWKDLTDVDPHIFDLYFGGALKHKSKDCYFDELIAQKKISFWDLDIESFKNSNGKLGSRGIRQLIQYENTKSNTEWFSSELSDELNKLEYPLHFIDFETYRGAIPHHKGMRPYDLIAFQWSCHTITSPDSEPTHSEWLNCDYDFPNFRFAESLMDHIKDIETPLMWSPFENSILKEVLEQMDIFEYKNDQLKQWLTNITTEKDLRKGRFVDMNDLTLKHYFHPDMKGKTSIKKVLPAVWNNNKYLHSIPWFKKYSSSDPNVIVNPYDTLSPVISELESEEVVSDGTGAMRAYHELMFGNSADNPEKREILKKLLLQYCELDTMAMVIIWKYWLDN